MNNHSIFLRRRICLTIEASLDGDHFLNYCKEKLDASHSYSLIFKDQDRNSPYNREFV